MTFRIKIIFFCLLTLSGVLVSQAQNTSELYIDSLKGKSFGYLENQFRVNAEEPQKAKAYVDAYLRLAKQKKHDSLITKGYFYQAYISDFITAIAYCDSIITFDTPTNTLLANAHDEKGYLFYTNSNYTKSLESYIQARNISKQTNNYQVLFTSTYSIGLIKRLIGQKEEALEIYKDGVKYFYSDALKEEFSDNYLENIFALADTYFENSKLDSATIYNKVGIQESLRMDKPTYYPRFILSEGATQYKKGAYNIANDSLSKAIILLDELKDNSSLAIAFYFKAKVLEQSGDVISAIESLKKADVLIAEQGIRTDFLPVYEALYENYKKTDSVEQQLIYLEKFIAYNEKLEDEFEGIDLAIYKQYDTPVLIESKEKIIQGLESKNKTNRRNILLLSIFLTVFCILSFYYYRKRIVYKKRYDNLIQQDFNSSTQTVKQPELKKSSKLPPEILEQLLPKIEAFETNKGFLDSSITLNKMAKLLESNSNYLSKTINHSKNKNFSSYLSDLRIEYTIQELKTDSKLLNYTIKAIASEVGFGNTESFTKAFYVKTNLNPSYFIKQLKKQR